jgi:hypothetical protein
MASANFDLAGVVWMPMGNLFTWSMLARKNKERQSSLKTDKLEKWVALRQTLLGSSGHWAVE